MVKIREKKFFSFNGKKKSIFEFLRRKNMTK